MKNEQRSYTRVIVRCVSTGAHVSPYKHSLHYSFWILFLFLHTVISCQGGWWNIGALHISSNTTGCGSLITAYIVLFNAERLQAWNSHEFLQFSSKRRPFLLIICLGVFKGWKVWIPLVLSSVIKNNQVDNMQSLIYTRTASVVVRIEDGTQLGRLVYFIIFLHVTTLKKWMTHCYNVK